MIVSETSDTLQRAQQKMRLVSETTPQFGNGSGGVASGAYMERRKFHARPSVSGSRWGSRLSQPSMSQKRSIVRARIDAPCVFKDRVSGSRGLALL